MRTTVWGTALCILLMLSAAGCAAQKDHEHFGTGENFPVFHGSGDFIKSLARVQNILILKRLDGGKVDMDWIDPTFREKICLVVTINNHCGGG